MTNIIKLHMGHPTVCFYRDTLRQMRVKIDCELCMENEEEYALQFSAYKLIARNIRYNVKCTINIVKGEIYCDTRIPIFKCLPTFFNSLMYDTAYNVYCQMIAMYEVGFDFKSIERLQNILKRVDVEFKIVVKCEQ